jgi:heat shock protein HslJ
MSAAALQGTTWRLIAIGGQPVLEGTTVTAEFSSDSRVAGAAGCNRYSGSARAEAGRLEIGPLASTMRACASEGVMLQEERYLATIEAATHYVVDGTELRLGTSTHDVTLVYSAL